MTYRGVNALAESFFATVQTELLDRYRWPTHRPLAAALFDYIERFYNRTRHHRRLGYLSPIDYETTLASPAEVRGMIPADASGKPGTSRSTSSWSASSGTHWNRTS